MLCPIMHEVALAAHKDVVILVSIWFTFVIENIQHFLCKNETSPGKKSILSDPYANHLWPAAEKHGTHIPYECKCQKCAECIVVYFIWETIYKLYSNSTLESWELNEWPRICRYLVVTAQFSVSLNLARQCTSGPNLPTRKQDMHSLEHYCSSGTLYPMDYT